MLKIKENKNQINNFQISKLKLKISIRYNLFQLCSLDYNNPLQFFSVNLNSARSKIYYKSHRTCSRDLIYMQSQYGRIFGPGRCVFYVHSQVFSPISSPCRVRLS